MSRLLTAAVAAWGTALVAAAMALTPLPAHAATERVDDSGTTVSTPLVNMRWRQLVPGRGSDDTLEGQLRVAVRLNLRPWLNRTGRIHMGLTPVLGIDPVHVNWRGQGRLLAGQLVSGQRALVYEGPITAATLEETLELVIRTDGRRLSGPQNLQFYFEIDTP